MTLRERFRAFLAPEGGPEPLVQHRDGAAALSSFAVFLLLLAPAGGLVFAAADSDSAPLWIVPPAVGLPAFAFAFFLPRRRRRLVALALAAMNLLAACGVAALVVLYLIAKANCPPDAYECPF